MIPRFREVCKAIMDLKDHRSRMVRAKIIDLLPALAQLCPDAFARADLQDSVDFLSKCAKIPDLRPHALVSTGKLCIVLGPHNHLVSLIDQLMSIVHEAFSGGHFKNWKGEKATTPTRGLSRISSKTIVAPSQTDNTTAQPALRCISDMMKGLGPTVYAAVLSLLEPMLQLGLSTELIETLSAICEHIPSQKVNIQHLCNHQVTF